MYYWIIVNNQTGQFGTGSSTHPQDESIVPQGYTYVNFQDPLDSTTQTAFDNPQAYLYQNGAFVSNPNYNALAFAQAQQVQLAILEQGMLSTLAGGFTAKTLVGGATTPHKYPTDANAQSNFTGVVTAFTVNPNKTTASIETLDAGWVSHTKTEFYNVYSDGDTWKEAQYAQYNNLVSQVNAATTVAAVQAITWTQGTY